MEPHKWEGNERREAKRRHEMERRTTERRKKYFFAVILPAALGILGAGLVSWGAYVTHATYSISAKYEETFVDHIDKQAVQDKIEATRIDDVIVDYNARISKLHDDMNDGFKEIRDTQNNIYTLLLQRGIGDNNSDGPKN